MPRCTYLRLIFQMTLASSYVHCVHTYSMSHKNAVPNPRCTRLERRCECAYPLRQHFTTLTPNTYTACQARYADMYRSKQSNSRPSAILVFGIYSHQDIKRISWNKYANQQAQRGKEYVKAWVKSQILVLCVNEPVLQLSQAT